MVIVVFIIILAVLVLSHELGHFSAAKIFGIRVDEFGLGFPPKIFSWRRGETVYSINIIPFGGFVKIFGEDPTADVLDKDGDDVQRSLYRKPRYVQAAVIAAGIFFNLILAWFALSSAFMAGLPVPVGFSSLGPAPENSKLIVTEVLAGSPAESAGLSVGDSIVSLSANDGATAVLAPDNVSTFIASHNGQELLLGYKTPSDDGTLSNIGLSPLDFSDDIKVAKVSPKLGVVGGRPAVGIAMDSVGILKLPLFPALYAGAIGAGSLFTSTVSGLIYFIGGLFSRKSLAVSVSGPVGLVGVVGSALRFGPSYILALVALISVNLAALNLVPFPALDGGRLLFLLVESIIQRPLNPKVVNALNLAGFILLLGLMVFVTYGDIRHLSLTY